MEKARSSPTLAVRDKKSGRVLTVKGAGALKHSAFALKSDVDLTKPIASQTLEPSAARQKPAS